MPFQYRISNMKFIKSVFILSCLAVVFTACSVSKKTGPEISNLPEPSKMIPEPVNYRASDPIMHNLIHTRLDVAFDWDNRQLIGSAEITLKPHFYPTRMLYLDARGMIINEVHIVKGSQREELGYVYRNDSICITLDRLYTRNDTLTVYIDYIARPESLPKGGSSAISSDKGLYFINADGSNPRKPRQIWTQGETQSSSVWFPTIDRPNQKTTQEIYITVDTSFVTLSNGKLISSIVNFKNGTRTDYWRQTLPHTPYLFMMAIGPYAVARDTWNNVEVSYYVEPEYEKYAKEIFAHTPEMLDFFSKTFGVKYPWEKYAQVVVRDFVSGAMENTTASIFGEFVQKDDRALYDAHNDDIVAHELSHHWFGNLVTCESWSNLALNESFATYSEYLWNEYKYGRDQADWTLNADLKSYLQEARTKQLNLIRFDYNDKEEMFDRHSYQKGGRILHMLRAYTGDEAFFAALKKYLEDNSYGAAEVHHLRLAFEAVTGKDMNWFFNQWFLDKGHPSLDISYEYDEASGEAIVTVEQKQNFETTPLYRLPVEIDIYTSAGIERKIVDIKRQRERFAFRLNEKPLLINFDARKMLLCTKTDRHTDQEFMFMLKNGPMLLDRMEALMHITRDQNKGPEAVEAIKFALNDAHWAIRSMAVKSARNMASVFRTELLAIARNDDNPSVRNDALEVLAFAYPKDSVVMGLMDYSMNDKSYRVMQTAVGYVADNDSERGLKLLKEMEKETNSVIRNMVLGFYVKSGSDEQYDFMTVAMSEADGFSMYSAVQNYGKFLLRCSADKALKGLNVLAAEGYNHPQWFVRLAASQSIAEMAKSYNTSSNEKSAVIQPGNQVLEDRNRIEADKVRKKAEELLTDIKSKETDPNLIRIYNR